MFTTSTPLTTAPAPVNPRAGSGVGGWRAATRGRSAPRRLGRLVFWLLIVLFIIAPSACFLVLAVSPRLFSQGTQWFTLAYLRETFTGRRGSRSSTRCGSAPPPPC
jgi:hypothetical protein